MNNLFLIFFPEYMLKICFPEAECIHHTSSSRERFLVYYTQTIFSFSIAIIFMRRKTNNTRIRRKKTSTFCLFKLRSQLLHVAV